MFDSSEKTALVKAINKCLIILFSFIFDSSEKTALVKAINKCTLCVSAA